MGHTTDPPSGRVAHEEKRRPSIDSHSSARPAPPVSIPRDFTLCREADLPTRPAPAEEEHGDDMYGVESLDDMLASVVETSAALEPAHTQPPASLQPDKKRKPGNPVHPNILAAGQKIVSSDSRSPKSLEALQDPIVIAGVPSFKDRLRAISGQSTASSSRKISPSARLQEASAADPRSISPSSLRLSDDDVASLDETASQVILSSSSGDEDVETAEPRAGTPKGDALASPDTQLVMPSLSLPSRRPITARGSQMGHMRILVAGRKEAGKSSLIAGMLEQCDDIVHSTPARTITSASCAVSEVSASTKAVPGWKRKASKPKLRKTPSTETMALERNLSILEADIAEAPSGFGSGLLDFVRNQSRSALAVDQMDDSQLMSLLHGESTQHIDVVLYLIKSENMHKSDAEQGADSALDTTSTAEAELISRLSALTNVIPVLADGQSATDQNKIQKALDTAGASCVSVTAADELPRPSNVPVCLRLTPNDTDTSIIWDSDAPSSVGSILSLTDALLSPPNISALRHTAIKSLIKSRNTHPILLPSLLPHSAPSSPVLSCSTISNPSAVLVPGPTSTYYASPSLSAHTIDSTSRLPSNLELALLHTPDPEPRIRIAQWALDLQKTLQSPPPMPHIPSGKALVPRSRSRCAKREKAVGHPDPLRILSVLHDPLPLAVRMVGLAGAVATLTMLAIRGLGMFRSCGAEANLVDAAAGYGQELGPVGWGWGEVLRNVFSW